MRIPTFLLINLATLANFAPLYASTNNIEEQDPIVPTRSNPISSIEALHAVILKEREREENPRPIVIDSFEEYEPLKKSYGQDEAEADDNANHFEDIALKMAIQRSLEGQKDEEGSSIPLTDISIDPELEEAIKFSMQVNGHLEKKDEEQSKFHFQLDSDGFPVEATVLQKTNWKTQNDKTVETLLAQHKEKGSKPSIVGTFTTGTNTILTVLPILGGGDCGFFAYGQGINRYTFVRDAIDAILKGSRFQTETRQASVDQIRQIFTQDLIQVANQQEPNGYLKRLGSKQEFEDLFGRSASAEPHVLANFIYECYGRTLECLSIHALKALALINNHTLFIWETNREPSDSKTHDLNLIQKHISSSPITIHIYYDSLGHFMPAVTLEDIRGKEKTEKKGFISDQLQLILEQKGIGAQEYELYTEEMKDLFLALCS